MKPKISCLLLISFCIIFSSCADRDFDNPVVAVNGITGQHPELQKGAELLNQGNLDEALTSFEKVLSEASENVDANVGMASIHLAKNNFEQVIAFSKKAFTNLRDGYTASFDPTINKDSVHLVLAQAYYYTGDFNRSNDQVRQLTGKNVQLPPESLIQEIERLGGGQ